MFKPEFGLQVEEIAQQLEIRASSPPQLQWRDLTETSFSLELEPSDVQPLVSTNVASGRSYERLVVLGQNLFLELRP
jgi:hypothetical protein